MSERFGKGAVIGRVPVATKGKLSDEERERILEQMRRELPELDRRYEKAISNLDRISRGLRPKA